MNNADPSVRRPLRVSDLQDLWDGLGTIFAGVPENTVKVVSGFKLGDNNTVLEGVLIYNHKLYYYEGGLATLGNTIYLYDVPSDPRMFADGQTRDFSFLNVATVAGIHDDGLVAVQLTPQFIADRLIGDALTAGSVTTTILRDGAVTSSKLATGAVSRKMLATRTSLPSSANPIQVGLEDSYLRINAQLAPRASYSFAVQTGEQTQSVTADKVGVCVVDIVNLLNADPENYCTITFEVYNSLGSLVAELDFNMAIKTSGKSAIRLTITSNEVSVLGVTYEAIDVLI